MQDPEHLLMIKHYVQKNQNSKLLLGFVVREALVWAEVGRLTEKGMRNLSRVMTIFFILRRLWVKKVYAFVKTHETIHLQAENCILWKLYLY